MARGLAPVTVRRRSSERAGRGAAGTGEQRAAGRAGNSGQRGARAGYHPGEPAHSHTMEALRERRCQPVRPARREQRPRQIRRRVPGLGIAVAVTCPYVVRCAADIPDSRPFKPAHISHKIGRPSAVGPKLQKSHTHGLCGHFASHFIPHSPMSKLHREDFDSQSTFPISPAPFTRSTDFHTHASCSITA